MKSCENLGSRSKTNDLLVMAILMVATILVDAGCCWEIETVDEGKRRFHSMTEQSIVVDSLGNPHIVYGADNLYYTWFDGTRWHYEIVDNSESVGSYASLDLSSSGIPHICYHDSLGSDLKYAYKIGGLWETSILDTLGYGGFPSMEVDEAGIPHVIYRDADNLLLKYATLAGVEWEIEVVDSNSHAHGSLEFDSEGEPHMGYIGNGAFRYAYRDGSDWHIEQLGDNEDLDLYMSIEIDDSNYVHACWYRATIDEGIYYAYKDYMGWHIEIISDGYCDNTSLELDNEGFPHLIYYKWGGLTYAYIDEGGWHEEQVNPGVNADWASLVLDTQGRAHISYKNAEENQIQYALRDGSGWEIQTIDWHNGLVGLRSSLALDSNERPFIAYYDYNRLRSLCLSYMSGDQWKHESILPGVLDLSLGLDSDDNPHIVFNADFEPDWDDNLGYAYNDGSGWQVEKIVEARDNGRYCSLRLDDNDSPHISYVGWSSRIWDVQYAIRSDNEWNIETVESSWDAPFSTSIDLDELGFPHIAVNGSYGEPLKYFWKNESGWNTEIIDSEIYIGYDVSIVLDGNGWPHVAYRDGTEYWDSDLRYAHKDESGWIVEVVDSLGHTGLNPSIAVDMAGYPHIAFARMDSNVMNADLKYAIRTPFGWHIEVVDTLGHTGGFCSLRLDSSGKPYISYYCVTEGSLKYARKTEGFDLVMGGNVTGGEFVLEWAPPVGSEHWVYGASNSPFFITGVAPGYDFRVAILQPDIVSWQSSAGIGIPGDDWTYMIIAVDEMGTEIGRSNRVGEMDFSAEIP